MTDELNAVEQEVQNIVSVEEVVYFYFDSFNDPAFFTCELGQVVKSGMASVDQLTESFRSWFKGWETGGYVNPPEEDILPELIARYTIKTGKQ